jgi:hypothetical protein
VVERWYVSCKRASRHASSYVACSEQTFSHYSPKLAVTYKLPLPGLAKVVLSVFSPFAKRSFIALCHQVTRNSGARSFAKRIKNQPRLLPINPRTRSLALVVVVVAVVEGAAQAGGALQHEPEALVTHVATGIPIPWPIPMVARPPLAVLLQIQYQWIGVTRILGVMRQHRNKILLLHHWLHLLPQAGTLLWLIPDLHGEALV